MKTIKLNNGVEMPVLGYGVFLVNSEECERCVLDAIEVGYRLIDTAQAYYNEDGVGRAIEKCGVPRNELFITTKVWISNAGEEKAFRSIGESLRKLKTDYIDLLLIHQPFGDYYGTYRAMERVYRDGMGRAIGLRFGGECGSEAFCVTVRNTRLFPTEGDARINRRLRDAFDGMGTFGTGVGQTFYRRDFEGYRYEIW